MIGLLLWCLTWAAMAQPAEEPGEQFLSANQAFLEERYVDSAEQYQALVDAGVAGPYVHYNLGNSWLRAGRLGQAIAAYRTAQTLAPRDADIAANLAFARGNVTDAIAPPGPSDLQRTLLFWHYAFSATELQVALAVTNVLFWTLLGLSVLRRESEWLRWATWSLAAPLLILTASTLLHALTPTHVGVVTVAEADVRAGDDNDAVLRFQLHEGTEMTLVEQRGNWWRVALTDGQGGWIRDDQIHSVRTRVDL